MAVVAGRRAFVACSQCSLVYWIIAVTTTNLKVTMGVEFGDFRLELAVHNRWHFAGAITD